MDAVFDVVVQLKKNLRRVPDNHLLAQLVPHKSGGLFQRGHHGLAVFLFQNADVNFGIAQVAGHVRPGHAVGALNARVGQILPDDAIYLPANLLADAVNTLITQCVSSFASQSPGREGPAFPLFQNWPRIARPK